MINITLENKMLKLKNYYKLFSIDREFIENLFQTFENEIEIISKKVFYCLIASLYLSLIPLHSHSKLNQELLYREFEYFYQLSLKEK